jgi:RHS repeat-associated protein
MGKSSPPSTPPLEIDEIADPLKRTTRKTYYPGGQLETVTDATGRTATYSYNHDEELTEISYSEAGMHNVTYSYNGDGKRTRMTDGSGTSEYIYDALDRLTTSVEGDGATVKYAYNLDNEPETITYPSGKAVTREYDDAGRLKAITDWSSRQITFGYNADGDVTTSSFPASSQEKDTYEYNEADVVTSARFGKGTSALAEIDYSRDKDGDITKIKTSGLPTAGTSTYKYDKNGWLTKAAGVTYELDEGGNIRKEGSDRFSTNAADELEKIEGPKGTTRFEYGGLGERVRTTPASGPATTYSYNEGGDLVAVTRSAEGGAGIEDTYQYNGDGLRIAQTLGKATTYDAWDVGEELPLILDDGTNSYVYGPEGIAVEQVSDASGVPHYLHHDAQGSMRLLTSELGVAEGQCSYTAYGVSDCEGAAMPLGYDGQYTDRDTGLVYLRARYYDPSTGEFTSVDPEVAASREVYEYGADSPLVHADPSGRSLLGDLLEAAHYIITAGAIVGCAAQPELCATAALFDVLLNSTDTGVQAALHEKSVASALKEEVYTLVGGAVSFGSAKFWGELTEWAEERKLLGTSEAVIKRNAKLLNSGAAQWNVVQGAVSQLLQEKEGKCTRTN